MSANALVRTVDATGASFPARGTLKGEPVTLYMYNNTISNTPQGVHVNAETGTTPPARARCSSCCSTTRSTTTPSRSRRSRRHSTDRTRSSHVATLAMDNIFDGSTTARGRHRRPGRLEHASVQPVLEQHDQRPGRQRPTATSRATSARSSAIPSSSTRRPGTSPSSRPRRRSTRPAARSAPCPGPTRSIPPWTSS